MTKFEDFIDHHFIAKLRYKLHEEGGRSTPAHMGYRPDLKFPFTERMFMARQMWKGTDVVFPGDTIIAKIITASPQLLKDNLVVGMEFTFNEGPNPIADGIILEIGDSLINYKE